MPPVRPARRPSLVAGETWLLRYMPVPFVELGRAFTGADCWGLHLLIIEHELGQRAPEVGELYQSTDLRRAEDLRDVVAAEAALWRQVPEPEPFAALLFGVRLGGRLLPAHVGTSLGGGRFLHSRQGVGVQMADLGQGDRGETAWGERLMGAYVYDR